MPFNELEKARIKRIVGGFCLGHIPKRIRSQIKIFYNVRGHEVKIIESRPTMTGSHLWAKTPIARLQRVGDPYRDRRSGDDRREVYDLEFFEQGGMERRSGVEIRQKQGRRVQCVNVSESSSVCPPRKSTRKIKANRP